MTANRDLQDLDLQPQFFYLGLLFFDGVHQYGRDAVVLNALDLPVVVVGHEQRLDRRDIFRSEANITSAARSPIERDRRQFFDKIKTRRVPGDVPGRRKAVRRRALGDVQGSVRRWGEEPRCRAEAG